VSDESTDAERLALLVCATLTAAASDALLVLPARIAAATDAVAVRDV